MNLKLITPLAFLEIQAIRIDKSGKPIVSNSRIQSVCAVKINPDGTEETGYWMVNPMMEDPDSDSVVVRLSDTPFRQVADSVRSFLDGCDVAGYNIRRFDLPLLAEEFARSGHTEFPHEEIRVVDIASIFHQHEPRDFSAAVKFYLDTYYTGHRNSAGDAMLCRQILDAQLDRYDLPNDTPGLDDVSSYGKKLADFSALLYWENGKLKWNFGKKKDCQVDPDDRYTNWFLHGDFPYQSKRIVSEETGHEWFLTEHQTQI